MEAGAGFTLSIGRYANGNVTSCRGAQSRPGRGGWVTLERTSRRAILHYDVYVATLSISGASGEGRVRAAGVTSF